MAENDGPVIIVTGASKGLGLAITTLLLSTHHARVIAISRSTPPALSLLEEQHESNLILVTGDISNPETSQEALMAAIYTWQRLDGVVLNAGTLDPLGPVASSNTAEWVQSFHTNFFSLLAMLQSVTPTLRKRREEGGLGRVVMVSSGAAVGNYGGWGCYSATKAAMNSLVRTYANEEKDIATFAVRPGVIDTDMQAQIRKQGPEGMPPAELKKFTDLHESGKLLKPEQPGAVIAALVVGGPLSLSGQFLNWEGEELRDFQGV